MDFLSFLDWLVSSWGFWTGWVITTLMVGIIDWGGISYGIFGDSW